jgi:hypothetical protein
MDGSGVCVLVRLSKCLESECPFALVKEVWDNIYTSLPFHLFLSSIML